MSAVDAMLQRRAKLVLMAAPHPRHDALVSLVGQMATVTVRLRYVPDRDLLSPESYADYLTAIEDTDLATLEETAQTILEDVNDQLIPCWLDVLVTDAGGGIQHEVRIEERQPKWNDRGLLDRLAP